MTVRMAMQCHAKTGEFGDFLYEEGDQSPFTPLSPVFPDALPFFQWCKKNGWKFHSWDGTFGRIA